MYFMDYMHGQGIGVILDWVPAHFPRDAYGMAVFDGTCVYEHMDPRKGSHPIGEPDLQLRPSRCIQFPDCQCAVLGGQVPCGRNQDGCSCFHALSDYGKNDGEWVPNIYGGNGESGAMEFLKHLNSVFKGRRDGAVIIAEESTAWPMVTGNAKEGGLGFDYKWNMAG